MKMNTFQKKHVGFSPFFNVFVELDFDRSPKMEEISSIVLTIVMLGVSLCLEQQTYCDYIFEKLHIVILGAYFSTDFALALLSVPKLSIVSSQEIEQSKK